MVGPVRLLSVVLGWAIVSMPMDALADELLPNGLDPDFSTRTGETFEPRALRLLPLYTPEQRGAAARSFENLALLLPMAQEDLYGISLAGATSPENVFIVDGIRIGDPVLGILRLPLSMEFVERTELRLSGADPVQGRGVGGFYDVQTRSGSNEWRVSAWSSIAPGVLEGARTPKTFPNTGIEMQTSLSNIFDGGAWMSGPLIKDRLFFFVGASIATRRYRLDRSLYGIWWPDGGADNPADFDPEHGTARKQHVREADTAAFAEGTVLQWIGKLNYRLSSKVDLSVSLVGTRMASGGDGTYHFRPESELIGVTNLNGAYSALARTETALSNVIVVRGTYRPSRKTRFDVAFGWVRGEVASEAADGSGIEDIRRAGTWAHLPGVSWHSEGTNVHRIDEFESVPMGTGDECLLTVDVGGRICIVQTYHTGGPGRLIHEVTDRFEAHGVVTTRISGFGEHRLRMGVDVEGNVVNRDEAYSGMVLLSESLSGLRVRNIQYGYMRGPDDGVALEGVALRGWSLNAGVFVADTWSIRKNLVGEASLRYDGQILQGAERSLALPWMLSPRVGLRWDPSRKGKSRIWVHYAYQYQAVPLNAALRTFSNETKLRHEHFVENCNIKAPEALYGGCRSSSALPVNSVGSPSSLFSTTGNASWLDPKLAPPAAHSFSLGAEVTVPFDVRVGFGVMRNELVRALEDVDSGGEFQVVGNPGVGAASAAPSATRSYQALSLSVMRPFLNRFVAVANYTYSWLHGNYAGFFSAETTQLDPNALADFDLPEFNANRTRTLPGDVRHLVKLYAGKAFAVRPDIEVEAGAGYVVRSGTPYYSLAPHSVYGSNTVFLPLDGGRLPWLHRVDIKAGVSLQLRKDVKVGASIEVYNVANGQTATAVDQTYTFDSVYPLTFESKDELAPEALNPRYGKPTSYQSPRQVRIGLRMEY